MDTCATQWPFSSFLSQQIAKKSRHHNVQSFVIIIFGYYCWIVRLLSGFQIRGFFDHCRVLALLAGYQPQWDQRFFLGLNPARSDCWLNAYLNKVLCTIYERTQLCFLLQLLATSRLVARELVLNVTVVETDGHSWVDAVEHDSPAVVRPLQVSLHEHTADHTWILFIGKSLYKMLMWWNIILLWITHMYIF